MWRGFVGSCWLGPGYPVLCADTRENPVGKNGVMTLGTPRHPFKKTVISFLCSLLFAKPKLLVLIMYKCPKFGRAIYQEWQMQFNLIWF
jgi:hypothetical protein